MGSKGKRVYTIVTEQNGKESHAITLIKGHSIDKLDYRTIVVDSVEIKFDEEIIGIDSRYDVNI